MNQVPDTAVADTATPSRLVVQGLQKSYGSRKVVQDVSLAVQKGEVVGLLGPNGAGKTTSFYMIVGLVRADAGEISNYLDSDVCFHRSLIDMLASPRITRVHRMLINEMRLCLVQVQSHKLLDPLIIANEHAGILDAISDGDEDLAAERGRAHLDLAVGRLTRYLTE